MPEGATVGASTGGVVGGTIGLLAGIGAWPYLAWVLSLLLGLSWQRLVAGPLEPGSTSSRETYSVWASLSTKPSVMKENKGGRHPYLGSF